MVVDQEGGKVKCFKLCYGFFDLFFVEMMVVYVNIDFMIYYVEVNVKNLQVFGFNVNFVLVVDFNVNFDNLVIGGIGCSFGVIILIVVEYVQVWIDVYQKVGILLVLKYFLGYGSFESDLYKGFIDVINSWILEEFFLYWELFVVDLFFVVMMVYVFNCIIDFIYLVIFLVYYIQDILCDSFCYDGVVFFDDL